MRLMKPILTEVVLCDRCKKDVQAYNGFPYIRGDCDADDHDYCYDCALILGVVSPMEYVDGYLFSLGDCDKAEYSDGKLVMYRKRGRGYSKAIVEVSDNVGIQR